MRCIQQELCKLAAHMQLSSGQLLTVMYAAINCGSSLYPFGRTSAIAELNDGDVADLLHAAALQRSVDNVEVLSMSKAAQGISSTLVAELIAVAMETCDAASGQRPAAGPTMIVKCLVSLPAAQHMREDSVSCSFHAQG